MTGWESAARSSVILGLSRGSIGQRGGGSMDPRPEAEDDIPCRENGAERITRSSPPSCRRRSAPTASFNETVLAAGFRCAARRSFYCALAWIPAFAGMTSERTVPVPAFAGAGSDPSPQGGGEGVASISCHPRACCGSNFALQTLLKVLVNDLVLVFEKPID